MDLTYITNRIIAMSFPGTGIEVFYRNSINEVSQFLQSRHDTHYKIYNLSQVIYDYNKFGGRVEDWCGWPDHHNPPLSLLLKIIASIHSWLCENSDNVVVIHCLAGKGRTGTVIASYLLYLGLFTNNTAARRYFTASRSRTNWGINSPAQIRYTEYFEELITSIPLVPVLTLLSIKIWPLPLISRQTGQTVISWTIYDYNTVLKEQPIIKQSEFVKYKIDTRSQTPIISTIPFNTKIQGDIWFVLYGQRTVKTEKIGFLALNTIFLLTKSELIGENEFRFIVKKTDIDGISTDDRISNDFKMEIRFTFLPHNEQSYKYQLQWTEYMKLRLNMTPCELNKDTSRPIHSGYLKKEGRNVKGLKKRWFVLYPDRLCYFQKPHLWPAKGEIMLKSIITLYIPYLDIKIPADMPYPFIISCPDREYIMTSETEKEREDWDNVITEQLKIEKGER